ncbi:MAG: topoisomerase DNA-binding C4 zinc finger domain-containing protein [Cyanobacteria bacterium SZAS LIN-5]|nr:topoisomerase DNA-binding C4 zinc finger domain-containing protein [Cyanobacteria bacterium SZAS LIN-5]
MTSLIVDGVNVRLGKRLGRGGEGEVFALENDDRALKVYTSTDIQQREAKILSIVNRKIAQQSSWVAFPLAIARHSDGRFAGFVMKRVNGHKPLFELYSPGARKKHFPKADFRFLVRTAANVSRAVASVHRTGCVIGDINHSGILISDEAKVALIDADSFQIIDGANKFLCRVGVPEYTPPELQGKKLSGIVRTANHDAFGLAVVIFQLLFMGRHPFVGAFAKGDMPMERAIFEHRFVYSQIRDVGMTRPPGAASLADFPRDVADAFERAFSPSVERRPNAEEWINILVKLETEVTQCSSDNLHWYPQAASECPWCRMESKLGILLFLPTFTNRGLPAIDPGAASFSLGLAWSAIERVVLPHPSQLHPTLPLVKYVPSAEAKKAKFQIYRSRAIGIALLITAAAIGFALPKMWFIWGAVICFALKQLFFCRISSEKYFVEKYFHSKEQFEKSITAWRTRAGITQAVAVKASLADAKKQLENLEREKHLKISLYQNKRHGMQLLKYLESHEIRKAKIRHVGLARQTALASYGIETALDITEEKVLEVPGFGANNSVPLLEWRKSLENAFVYDPKPNDMDQQELQKIQIEIDQKGSDYRRTLTSGPSDLTQAVYAINAREKKEDPVVAHAYAAYFRDKEDLAYLKIQIPKTRPKDTDYLNFNSARNAALISGAVSGTVSGAQPQRVVNSVPTGAGASNNTAVQTAPTSAAVPQFARVSQAPPPPSNSSGIAPTPVDSFGRSSRTVNPRFKPSKGDMPFAPVSCPKCGQSMIKRVARGGKHDGKMFYGCSAYPACNGVRNV